MNIYNVIIDYEYINKIQHIYFQLVCIDEKS